MRGIKNALVLTLAVLCLMSSAFAANVLEYAYSNAPANPTQDNVKEIRAFYLPKEQEKLPCAVAAVEPSQLTLDTLKEIFDFVDINCQPPARWFPEETRKEIEKIIDGDPDSLYMPEFMSLLPEKMQLDADVEVDMHMNIDYAPGQQMVLVLGRVTEDGLAWKALPGQNVEEGDAEDIIRFMVPRDVAALYAGRETLFALLAAKPVSGEQEKEQVIREEEVFVPSKNASDIVYVVDEIIRNLAGEPVDCKIIIVPKNQPIEKELEKMTAHFMNPEKTPIRYFDEETVQETALILKDTDINTLLPYEFMQVMAVDYLEPYGDVMAKFAFPTPFDAEKAVIAMIGVPDQEDKTVFHWMPLHTEKKDYLEITFSSSVLPAMTEDAGILLVMSEPLEE